MCVHGRYRDFKTLIRSNLWNENVQNDRARLIEECDYCYSQSIAQPYRRVPLESLNREFNDVVTLEHLNLDCVTLSHAMYATTTFLLLMSWSRPHT